ncbi:phage head closure protein [Metabacillus idriensis]|uniref:phage head closure protein n=1 Tax=Metabacillus idriensis TaxID=324768 RepID=UPI00174B53BD|nr:phage head closure protein [Metabacillus idriensis]MCM3599006.1 phage head closure protein [Metabacillus idriensis]
MQPFKYTPRLSSGQFRHRITFQNPPNPDDTNENGFPVGNWENVISVWAMNKTVSGREYFQAAATQNDRTSRWIIRFHPGLSEDMRIVFEGKYFEIEAILTDDELKNTLTIVSKEVL